jgi:hypothetical protein
MPKKIAPIQNHINITFGALLLATCIVQSAEAGTVGSIDSNAAPSSSLSGPTGSSAGAAQIGGVITGPSAPAIRLNSNAASVGARSPYVRWRDALSTDLLYSDRVHARLKYFKDNSRNGSHQGVGIAFSLSE